MDDNIFSLSLFNKSTFFIFLLINPKDINNIDEIVNMKVEIIESKTEPKLIEQINPAIET